MMELEVMEMSSQVNPPPKIVIEITVMKGPWSEFTYFPFDNSWNRFI